MAPIWPQAWELAYAMGAALKRKKKKKKILSIVLGHFYGPPSLPWMLSVVHDVPKIKNDDPRSSRRGAVANKSD